MLMFTRLSMVSLAFVLGLPLQAQQAVNVETPQPLPGKDAAVVNSSPVLHSPDAPEDDTVYKYTGFNSAAGVKSDGVTPTGGMVNFNIKDADGNPAFACDTVSSNAKLSPWAYVKGDRLYCISKTDHWTGAYQTMTLTEFDANTLEELSSKTVDVPDMDNRYVPKWLVYDDQSGLIYGVSQNRYVSGGNDEYYFGLFDPETVSFKLLGMLGDYVINRESGNFTMKGMAINYGTVYITYSDGRLMLGQVPSVVAPTVKKVGIIGAPGRYIADYQPILYNSDNYKLLLNRFDLELGTIFYDVDTYAPFIRWDADLGQAIYGDTVNAVVAVDPHDFIPGGTGYSWFYRRPASVPPPTYNNRSFLPVEDFNVTMDGNTATISFTAPEAKYEDGTDIEWQTWHYDYSKKVRVNLAVNTPDNTYPTSTLPSQVEYGAAVEGTIELPNGANRLVLTLSPTANDLNIAPTKLAEIVIAGYDAPAAVGNANLSIEDKTATITWTAPTKGRYDDFGAPFDAEDLTYRVVRNTDGVVVAEGITETTCVDATLGEEIQNYTYSVYASSHGVEGLPAVTNMVCAGDYAPLPYINGFNTSNCLDSWTVLNVNNNGTARTWSYNNYWGMVSSSYGEEDDWLISPPVRLAADKLYALNYNLGGAGNLIITVGKGNTPEAQDTQLETISKTYNFEGNSRQDNVFESLTTYFTPQEDGEYRFAFHNYDLGENDMWNIYGMSITEVGEATLPAAPEMAFTPAEKGALSGTIEVTLPTADSKGNALSEVSKITVYNLANEELATGDAATTTFDVTAVKGWNKYRVAATNEVGEGMHNNIWVYVGPDVPLPVTNIKAKVMEDDDFGTVLSWDAPSTVGVNGGYVDPETLSYKVYQYVSQYVHNFIVDNGNETTIEIDNQGIAQQDYLTYSVTAYNDEGESEFLNVGVVAGTPYELPFEEPWASNGTQYSPWITASITPGTGWTVDQNSAYNQKITAQNNDQVMLVMPNLANGPGEARFCSPRIDFTNAAHPMFSVWLHHGDNMAFDQEVTVSVDATTDGSEFFEVAPAQSLTGNSGWTQHFFDLSVLSGKKAQIALRGSMPTPQYRIFADNWNIYECDGADLALTAISEPYAPIVGETHDITVTVANSGSETLSDYSVLFYLNDEAIEEVEGSQALAPGETAQLTFPLTLSVALDEIIYSAELLADGDTNEDNNYSTEVELTPEQLELPAPSNLLVASQMLQWTAPEVPEGREVTLDFENIPGFTTNNIAGWTTVDGDGHRNTCYETSMTGNGPTWPFYAQVAPWYVWAPAEGGTNGQIFLPKNGEKCLIVWGNYGVDDEGRDNTSEPEDDWLISPEIMGGTELSFITCTNSQAPVIDILTSTTDNKPESFTNKVQTLSYSSSMSSSWYNVSVTLPEDAKYVAFHVTNNDYATLVDDLHYTLAAGPQLQGYNVYGSGLWLDLVADNSYPLTTGGLFAVSAKYDLGESALCENTVATAVKSVETESEQVEQVYDLSGRRIDSKQRGVNIVRRADGKAVKVVVK